jgi:hypothetical protein
MEHWDGRDRDQTIPFRLPERDRQRIHEIFLEQPRLRRQQPQIHSLIGLALALGVLVGLALLLTPSSPVSPHVIP